jgi:PEP-CTERM motif
MNAAAAGKLALCICTGAVIGAGVNEARHDASKPKVVKTAAKGKPAVGRKVVQFPCEPYIVQDQMLRDAEIPTELDIGDMPQLAAAAGGADGARVGVAGGNGGDGGSSGIGGGAGGGNEVPEPATLALFGLGALGVAGGRKLIAARLLR